MNPYYAPFNGKPPLVERWAECRPQRDDGAYLAIPEGAAFAWMRVWSDNEDCPPEIAVRLTRCAVLEACGKVLHETLPDGRVQLRDEFVGQRWVFHLGEAASLGNDIAINELAHQLCDVKEQP